MLGSGYALERIADLEARILEEREHTPRKPEAPEQAGQDLTSQERRVEQAVEVLEKAQAKGKVALAYSGGLDSGVLLEIAKQAGIEATLLWVDTRMEAPATRSFVMQQAQAYGYPLAITRAPREPIQQWQATGWPMLGKRAARIWNQTHGGAGFKLNMSECCRTMKIGPGRRLARNLGAKVQVTGSRGKGEGMLHALRIHRDGPLTWQAKDKIWIAHPLAGWTSPQVALYAIEHKLAQHPAKARGAETIGCIYCAGGSDYDNSGYRALRRTWPAEWRQLIVKWGAGAIVLAVKYHISLELALEAIRELGGLERLAEERPWIFDYTRTPPLPGYSNGARELQEAA